MHTHRVRARRILADQSWLGTTMCVCVCVCVCMRACVRVRAAGRVRAAATPHWKGGRGFFLQETFNLNAGERDLTRGACYVTLCCPMRADRESQCPSRTSADTQQPSSTHGGWAGSLVARSLTSSAAAAAVVPSRRLKSNIR